MEVGGREFLHLGQLQQTGFSFLWVILQLLLLLEDGVVGPSLDAVDVEAGEAGVTAPDGVCPRPI